MRIIVRDAAHEAAARRRLKRSAVDLAAVEFYGFTTDRGWIRDMGPMFVRRASRDGELVVADFRFTGWSRYENHGLDDRVARLAAEALGLDRICPAMHAGRLELAEDPATYDRRFVLEGGAIDVNGRGTLLTTEQCLLDNSQQPRNPDLSRDEIDAVLGAVLGVNRVFYLGEGITGDDTGGHVDDLCRFVGPRTVVVLGEDDPNDANYRPLCEARERLADLRLEDDGRAEVVVLPSPKPIYFDGVRLPASYANFYIANAAVLVPTFNDPADRTALGLLAELFPGRKVVGIHAVDLVLGYGTIHCLTQQQPAASAESGGPAGRPSR